MTEPVSPNAPPVIAMIGSLHDAICTHTGRIPFGVSAPTVFDAGSTRKTLPGPGVFAEAIDSGYPAAIESGAQQVTAAAVLGSFESEGVGASAIGHAFAGDIGALTEFGFSDENARALVSKVSSIGTRIPDATEGHPLVWFEGIDSETGEPAEVLVSPVCSTKVLQEMQARLTDRKADNRLTLPVSVGGAKPQNSGHLAYKRTRSTRYGQYRAFRFRMPTISQTSDAQMIRRVIARGTMFAACGLPWDVAQAFLEAVEKTWSGSPSAFPGFDVRAGVVKEYEARLAARLVSEFLLPLEGLRDILSTASPSLFHTISDRLPIHHRRYLTNGNGKRDDAPELAFEAMKPLSSLLTAVHRAEARKNGDDQDGLVRSSTLSALRSALLEIL